MIDVYKYAKSLFLASQESDVLDEVIHDYETLVGALKHAKSWIDLVDSPVLTRAQKKKLIMGLENAHPIFINFLILLMKDYQIRSYEAIYEEFLIMARDAQSIAYVRVIVAKPLNADQITILKDEIHGWFEDMDIELEIIIDKRLLGGIRIMYQGQTIDRSFYSELQELKANIY